MANQPGAAGNNLPPPPGQAAPLPVAYPWIRRRKYKPRKPKVGAKQKKKSHPANAFILFYLDEYYRYGGDMRQVAKDAARRWKTMSVQEKDKYRRDYIVKRNSGCTCKSNKYRRQWLKCPKCRQAQAQNQNRGGGGCVIC